MNLTLGVAAHVDAGKTTLCEQLLRRAGVIRACGRVDHGDAFLDTEALERERGITIFAKQAVLTRGETELYLRLSNWLVIRRRETLQLKSHAMQVLQLIWRGLFVDMAQQVIAASELKDERLSARRQAVAETLSLSDEQLKEGVDILRQNFSTIAAFNVLMTLLSDTYQIDTFGYVIDADDELVMYEEARTLDELSGHRAGLFDLAEIAVTRDKLDDARAILEGGYTFPMADTRLLDSLLR